MLDDTTWLNALGFLGFCFVLLFSVTGAYVWLRWGYAGVRCIWRYREMIDAGVRSEAGGVVTQ